MVTREVYDYGKGEYLEILFLGSQYLVNHYKKNQLKETYNADKIKGDIGESTELWLSGKLVVKTKPTLVSTFKLLT
jgi:hypothetical protein